MQQREGGLEHTQEGQQEWSCSRWKPGALEVQGGTMSWGESWEQQGAKECFAEGAEKQLLGGGLDSMRLGGDEKWRQELLEATQSGN